MRSRADFSGRIKGARIDVAGLHADEGAVIEGGQRICSHPSLRVRREPA